LRRVLDQGFLGQMARPKEWQNRRGLARVAEAQISWRAGGVSFLVFSNNSLRFFPEYDPGAGAPSRLF
jgi:hypothetical protein